MVMSLRIAHVTATFPPYQAGTGIVAYYNAVELVRRGHEVHVFTTDIPGEPREEMLDGVHIHRLVPWAKHGNAALLPQLLTRLRGFDLVHLHLPFYGGVEAVWAFTTMSATPLVTTHHQDVVLPSVLGRLTALHDDFFSRRLMSKARFACFTSRDYAAYSKFGRDDRLNITELPNGVDVRRFSLKPRDERLAVELGIDGQRVVLFVGALDRAHYFKGVHQLLEAVQLLAREDVSLIVVGAGNLREEYRQKAKELGLSERVIFPGFVPDDTLPDYYRLADVTVLPSVTAGEAFGLVLLESLACGTPVIASNLPGVRTVVADGVDGYLVAPGDSADLKSKLEHILNLPDETRHEMGMTGRRKVEARYSWQHIGDLLEGLYIEALKQPAGGRPAHVETGR